MRAFCLFNLSILAFVASASSQDMCSNPNKVVSPVVPKPIGGGFSANCSTLVVFWNGMPGESYEITGSYIDPATNQKIEITPFNSNECDADANCSTGFNVVAGTTVNWTVQASDVIKGRTFYSYPFRSKEGAAIPTCESSNIVKKGERKDKTASSNIMNKVQGELYPNPVQSVVNRKFNSTSNKNQIKVFDVNGRTIISKQAIPGNMQLNVSSLRSGLYIMRIENNNGKALYTARFVKS